MTTLASISASQLQKEVTANENFKAVSAAGLFGRRYAGISGLTWAFYGGILYVDGVASVIADGTVALTNSATNYIERTRAGVVSANTSGFTAGRVPLYTAVTSGGAITSFVDYREFGVELQKARVGVTVTTADVTLTADQARVHEVKATGTLTGNRSIIVPAVAWSYIVDNATGGAYSLTAKTAAGSGVAVPQGYRALVYCDGTDVKEAVTGFSGAIYVGGTLTAAGGTITTGSATSLSLGTTAGSWLTLANSKAHTLTAASLQLQDGSGACTLNVTNAAGGFLKMQMSDSVASLATIDYTNTLTVKQGGTTNILVLPNTGVVGVGVTPSISTLKGIEITGAGNTILSSASNQLLLSANAYYNSGWKYGSSSTASQIDMESGAINFNCAGSGTAGNAITWSTYLAISSTGIVSAAPGTLGSTAGNELQGYRMTVYSPNSDELRTRMYRVNSVSDWRDARYDIYRQIDNDKMSGISFSADSSYNGIVEVYAGPLNQTVPSLKVHGVSSNARWLTITGATSSTNPTIGVSAGNLALSPSVNIGVALANYLELTGNSAGNGPNIFTVGSDTNINLNLLSKGTGLINFYTNAAAPALQLVLSDTAGASRLPNGIRIGADSTNNLLDDASNGAGTATLYIGNASINVTSDIRLTRDREPTKRNGLDIVRNLAVVDAWWKDPTDRSLFNRNSRGRWMKLIAQQAEPYVPWLINAPNRFCPTCRAGLPCEEHPQPWHFDYAGLAPVFVDAIQRLDARIAAGGL